jgi:hypothetical protein
MNKPKMSRKDCFSKDEESPVIYLDEGIVKMCKSIKEYKMIKKINEQKRGQSNERQSKRA